MKPGSSTTPVSGSFSGAVRDELGRAENTGLKNFVLNVFDWVSRIRHFFASIATGFPAGIDAAKPTIDSFMAALRRVGEALGFLSERDDAGAAAARFEAFGAAGERVGRVLSLGFEILVRVMTSLVEVAQGVAEGWTYIKP